MIHLSSKTLTASVEPDLGGRITSVFHREKGLELLFQNPRPLASGDLPQAGTPFDPWAWGWDECWPLIDAENWKENDHGDLWCQRAAVQEQSETGCTLILRGLSLPALITKTISVSEDGVEISLSIRNVGTEPFHGFWTCHPLLRIADDMTLYPDIPFDDRLFVGKGTVPFSGSQPLDGTYGKFWIKPRSQPTGPSMMRDCGAMETGIPSPVIRYPSLGMEARLTLLEGEAPYLGYWVTRGGFQGDHNGAWEFSDGFHDGPSACRKNGAWPVYRPWEEKRFRYRVGWQSITDGCIK